MKSCIKWLIGLSVFCVLLVPSIGATQTVEPNTGLAVFDAAGVRVGPVVGILDNGGVISFQTHGGVWFTLKVGDTTVLLAQHENDSFNLGLLGTQKDGMNFESSNCTGQPVFDTSDINKSDLMRMVQAVVGGLEPNTVELSLPHPLGLLESPFIHRLLGDARR